MTVKRNKNYQRIEHLIIDAYNQIVVKTGGTDVSITELCEVAHVNRTTFYKHFSGIYEITEKLENELIFNLFNLEFGKDLDLIKFLKNPYPAFEVLNATILKNVEYYRQILRPDRTRYIIDKTTSAVMNGLIVHYPKIKEDLVYQSKVKMNVSFFIGAISNLYLQWFRNYINLDIKQISEHICKILIEAYKNIKEL